MTTQMKSIPIANVLGRAAMLILIAAAGASAAAYPDNRGRASALAKRIGLDISTSEFTFRGDPAEQAYVAKGHRFSFFPSGVLNAYQNEEQLARRMMVRPGQTDKFTQDRQWANHAKSLITKLWTTGDLEFVQITKTKEKPVGPHGLRWASSSNRVTVVMKQDDGNSKATLFHATMDRATGEPLILIRSFSIPWPPQPPTSPPGWAARGKAPVKAKTKAPAKPKPAKKP